MKKLERAIQQQQNEIQLLDEKVDTQEDFEKFGDSLITLVNGIESVSLKIDKLKSWWDKDRLSKMLADTWMLVLNLYEDGEVDDWFSEKTDSEIRVLSNELSTFIADHIQKNRISIQWAIWTEYFEQKEWEVTTMWRVWNFVTLRNPVNEDWDILSSLGSSNDLQYEIYYDWDGSVYVLEAWTAIPGWLISYIPEENTSNNIQYRFEGQLVTEVLSETRITILRAADWTTIETDVSGFTRVESDWRVLVTRFG